MAPARPSQALRILRSDSVVSRDTLARTNEGSIVNHYVALTIDILMAVVIGLSLYDIWVGRTGGADATISWVLWKGAQKWPTIPFAFGYLMGHLFARIIGPDPAVNVVVKMGSFWVKK